MMVITMPCPYFYPEKPASNLTWNHSSRLPLGNGWQGRCCSPGRSGLGDEWPSEDDLRAHCNLGYASNCQRMPLKRDVDAVRFGVFRNGAGTTIHVHFVRERRHLPFDHGTLIYDPAAGAWTVRHSDAILQRQAECFLETWRTRNASALVAGASKS